MLGTGLAALHREGLAPGRGHRTAGPAREPIKPEVAKVKAGQARHEALLRCLLGDADGLADGAPGCTGTACLVDEVADELVRYAPSRWDASMASLRWASGPPGRCAFTCEIRSSSRAGGGQLDELLEIFQVSLEFGGPVHRGVEPAGKPAVRGECLGGHLPAPRAAAERPGPEPAAHLGGGVAEDERADAVPGAVRPDRAPRHRVGRRRRGREGGAGRALDGFDLVIEPGEITGLVGHNGAGKTTFVEVVTGLIRPDRGQVSVGGVDVRADPRAARRLLGVAPQELGLYFSATVRDNLRLFGA